MAPDLQPQPEEPVAPPQPAPAAAPDLDEDDGGGSLIEQLREARPPGRIMLAAALCLFGAVLNLFLVFSFVARTHGWLFFLYLIGYSLMLAACALGLWMMRKATLNVLLGVTIANVAIQGLADTLSIPPLIFPCVAVALGWFEAEYMA